MIFTAYVYFCTSAFWRIAHFQSQHQHRPDGGCLPRRGFVGRSEWLAQARRRGGGARRNLGGVCNPRIATTRTACHPTAQNTHQNSHYQTTDTSGARTHSGTSTRAHALGDCTLCQYTGTVSGNPCSNGGYAKQCHWK